MHAKSDNPRIFLVAVHLNPSLAKQFKAYKFLVNQDKDSNLVIDLFKKAIENLPEEDKIEFEKLLKIIKVP